MSTPSEELGEGHSPAAWTAVIVMLLGLSIGTAAFYFAVEWLVWSSAGLVLVGALLGWILSKAGWGVNGPKYRPTHHS